MRIEKLTLRGFLRFRDPLTIDLTAIPEGLVAIVGRNGAGKTTLLEAAPAALYRSFMSRGDVLDYATGRDSFLDLQVAVDGHGTYRARVNCDGPKRASDAVLEAVLPNGSRRVLNDGKVSTFDQAVARVFPSKEVLLASAFASQNKAGTFISLDKKGRKLLFAQLLGIERYEAMAQTARQAAGFCEQARMRLQAHRDVLLQDTSDRVLDELHAVANQLHADGLTAIAAERTAAAAIAALEARLATMSDVVAAYGAATQRIATLRTEVDSRTRERETLAQDAAHLRDQLTTDLGRLTAKRDADLGWIADQCHGTTERETQDKHAAARKREADLADIDRKIAGNQQLLGMALQIRGAIDQTVALDAQLLNLEARASAVRVAIDEGQRDLTRLERQLADTATQRERLDRATTDAALLGSVPCGGQGTFAPCQFLANAKAADARIPALREAVEAGLGLRRDADALAEVLTQRRQALADLHKESVALKAQRDGLAKLTQYAEPLAAAEARLAELRSQAVAVQRDFEHALVAAEQRRDTRLTELQAQRLQVSADAEAEITTLQARADAALRVLEQRRVDVDGTIARLTRDMAAAEADLQASERDNQAVVQVRATLAERRAERDRLLGVLARVDSGRQELDRRRAEVQAKRARLAAINTRLQRLDDELLDWQTLAKAFGATGLPVLEIDAAGPTISAYTNELLEVCFGPRFSVDLVTQVTKADGKGSKEDFSIRVLDNQRGGDARDIADLSGGEQVIVAEALSNAISIYVNTRSAMPIRTCWRDETTGALDPENATRYLAMLRKVQALGGFSHVLFISHNPDAAAQADAQIQLVDGSAAVVFPPYARVEAA